MLLKFIQESSSVMALLSDYIFILAIKNGMSILFQLTPFLCVKVRFKLKKHPSFLILQLFFRRVTNAQHLQSVQLEIA